MKKRLSSLIILLMVVAVFATAVPVQSKANFVNGYDWAEMTVEARIGYIRGAVDVLNALNPSDPIDTSGDIAMNMALMVTKHYEETYPYSYTVIDVIMDQ